MAVPPDARNLVIQVLTTSGPAPDALVVPLVDENYEAPGINLWPCLLQTHKASETRLLRPLVNHL